MIPSPDGKFLLLLYGEGRRSHSCSVLGATLFRRDGCTFSAVGDLPHAAEKILLLNGGVCTVCAAGLTRVELIRYVPDGCGLKEEARSIEITGMALSEPHLLLLSPGEHALIGAVDRDDGHGWSDPVYTQIWRQIDLRSGNLIQESHSVIGRSHLLLAPGATWASPYDGGDLAALRGIMEGLPFRREWPLRVGPRRLLTTSRVIDVMTGETLVGELNRSTFPKREFFDLSSDEKYALSYEKEQGMELWNVRDGSAVRCSFRELEGVRCAAFLGAGEFVLGGGDGRGALVCGFEK